MLSQRSAYRRRIIAAASSLLLVLIACLFVLAPTAKALDEEGPDPADLGGQPGDDYSYVVTSAGYAAASIPTTTVLVYFTENTSTKQVKIYDSNLCTDGLDRSGGGGNQRDRPATGTSNDGSIPANGTPITNYYVTNMGGAVISNTETGVADNSNDCYRNSTSTVTINNANLTYEPTAGNYVYKAQFVAEMRGTISNGQNRFSIKLVDGNGQRNGIVGYSALNQPDKFGVARDAPSSGYRDYSIPFAGDCSLNGTDKKTVSLYDLDYGDPNVQDRPIKTYIYDETTGERMEASFTASKPTSLTVVPLGNHTYDIHGESKQTVYMKFDMTRNHKYRLHMSDIMYVNILQFRLPYDSIYYLTGCNEPTTVACAAIETNPANPEPGQPVTVTGVMTYAGGPPNPSVANYSLKITGESGLTQALSPVSVAAGGGRVRLSGTVTLIAPGKYTVTSEATVNGVYRKCEGNFGATNTFTIDYHPYFTVNGGDLVAGSSIGTPTVPCAAAPHNDQAGIVSWNYDGTPNYIGASAQYAAMAYGQIQSFVTGQTNPSPNDLSFADKGYTASYGSSVDLSAGLFGGMFSPPQCSDVWSKKPAAFTGAAPGTVLAAWPSNVYYVNGDVTLDGSVLPAGKHITLYVEGNVAINDNITFQISNYVNRSQLPSLRIVAHGSIYINKDVTQLDGVYAAIPDSPPPVNDFNAPKNGTVITCATGFTAFNPGGAATNGYFAQCQRRLTVYGSVIGNQIWLLRTGGSLSIGGPAEVFNYTPETWLAPSGEGITTSDYQSIVGLPPVL